MPGHIVAVMADPHLSAQRPYTAPAWEAATALVRAGGAERVIVAGDVVLDACDDADDRAHAASVLGRLGLPVHAIPGNHDIGDNVPNPWMGEAITEARLQAWHATHGPDRFALEVADWLLLGINSQILGTGFAAEADQFAWAGDVVQSAGARAIALFLHKPLPVGPNGVAGNTVDAASARRLAGLFAPRLVVSAHLHQHRVIPAGGAVHVWAPSTAWIGREHGLGPASFRNPGVLMLHFHGDQVAVAVREVPAGVAIDPVAMSARHGEAPRHWPSTADAPR
jgi:3',5'-cyclic AMP phosphodiesterase CpdA